MHRKAPTRSDRSSWRRRLEAAIQLLALIFFVALGFAIYQKVSQRQTAASGPSTHGPIEAQSNSVAPSETRPRDGELTAASPNEQTPVTALPGETRPSEGEPSTVGSSKSVPDNAPPGDAKQGEEGPSTTAATKPAPDSAPPSDAKQGEEGPSTTATITPEPKAALLSPASLECATGSPTSWEFANVVLIDSTSSRTSSLVTSCRINPVIDGPASCQNTVIVGVGVASSKGINATESARALRRGTNLASALKKDLQARCTTNVTVAAYVLNLGRYSDEQQRDEPDQRKVIALVATGLDDADKAAMEAVATYTKSDHMITHYPICELYKLDNADQPTRVPTQRKMCDDQSASTASQQ
jgi:hypothetical protein